MFQSPLIEDLRSKIAQIVSDNRMLRDQAAKLRQSSEKLKAEKMELQQRIAELEHRLNVVELSSSMGGGDPQQKKLARARVNRLMREVDRCVALINKQ